MFNTFYDNLDDGEHYSQTNTSRNLMTIYTLTQMNQVRLKMEEHSALLNSNPFKNLELRPYNPLNVLKTLLRSTCLRLESSTYNGTPFSAVPNIMFLILR